MMDECEPQPGERWQIETQRYGAQVCTVGYLPGFRHFGLMYLFQKPGGAIDGLEVGGLGAQNPMRLNGQATA